MIDENLKTLMLVLAPRVRSYIEHRLEKINRKTANVEELMNEFWVRFLTKVRNTPVEDIGNIQNYMFRVVVSVIHDAFKNEVVFKKRRKSSDLNLSEWSRLVNDHVSGDWAVLETPSSALFKKETANAVLDRLSSLSLDQKEAIRMRYIEGLPFKEVARRMDRSVSSVNGLVHRGLVNLRESMGHPKNFFSDVDTSEEFPRPDLED